MTTRGTRPEYRRCRVCNSKQLHSAPISDMSTEAKDYAACLSNSLQGTKAQTLVCACNSTEVRLQCQLSSTSMLKMSDGLCGGLL